MNREISEFRPKPSEPPPAPEYPLTPRQAEAHKARDKARLKYEAVIEGGDGDAIWERLQSYWLTIEHLCRVDPTYYECRR